MTTTASPTETSRSLMKRMYDSATAGRFDDVLDCLSEDVVVNEPPFLSYGRVYRGHTDFVDLIAGVTRLLDVSKLTVDRMVADGDHVIGIIRMPDLKTGEDILLAEESLIRDGKVVEIWVYFNEAQTLRRREPCIR